MKTPGFKDPPRTLSEILNSWIKAHPKTKFSVIYFYCPYVFWLNGIKEGYYAREIYFMEDGNLVGQIDASFSAKEFFSYGCTTCIITHEYAIKEGYIDG